MQIRRIGSFLKDPAAMNKSRAWRAIEKVAELNELVHVLNRFGERAGLNRGEYRSVMGIEGVDKIREERRRWASRAGKTDMSPRAISARLKRVSELRRVCLALGRAKSARSVLDGYAEGMLHAKRLA